MNFIERVIRVMTHINIGAALGLTAPCHAPQSAPRQSAEVLSGAEL